MTKYDLCLNNATIIDENGNIFDNYSVGIINGKIEYIGDTPNDALRVINCENKVITSTLANAHTHSPMNILKGIAEDVSLDDWFNDKIWPYESSLIPQDIYLGAKLGIYEMINNGISVFADHYFLEDKIIEAVMETKVRVDIAPTIFSGENFNERIKQTLILNEKYKNHSKIRVSWGPHSPYLCNPNDLELIGELAKKHTMKIHMHIGETDRQLKEHIAKHNETPMETLKRTGLLNLNLILAHSLHFKNDDLKLFKQNHFIPLSIKTYMKLAMDIDLMLDNLDNFNWGFGTDGAASSASVSIIEQARIFALYLKYKQKDSTLINLKTLWKKIMNTHKAFDFNSGIMAKGMAADLIIWDLNKTNTMPNHDLLASIIYSSDTQNIQSVIIDGKFVKENNNLIGFDQKFIEDIKNHKARILKVGKGKTSLQF